MCALIIACKSRDFIWDFFAFVLLLHIFFTNLMRYAPKYIFTLLMALVSMFPLSAQFSMRDGGSQTGSSSSFSRGGNAMPSGSGRSSGATQVGSLPSSSANASDKEVALRIRSWSIDDVLGMKQQADLDTMSLNFQNMAVPERKDVVAASYLANIGSPFQSMIYKDRQAEESFIFMQPYDHWKTSNSEMCYINTTRPYTNGTYLTTVGNDRSQEENFKFFFTANFNKRLNIGADYEVINSRGYYTNLASRDKIAHFFTNYQGERYQAHGRYSIHRFENYENGGITNDDYITNPLEMSGGYREYESLNIPVNLSNTFNLTKYNDLFFNHKYHIGFHRKDTMGQDTLEVFVPVSSIIHTFQWDNGSKLYDSKTANLSYYDNVAHINRNYTADSVALMTLRNTVGLSLNEGFHPWMKFGLVAYAEHEYRRYGGISDRALPPDSDLDPFRQSHEHHENLLWLGGRLLSTQDSILQFNADARLCMLGERLGNFDVEGDLQSHFRLWKQLVGISAEGFVRNETPDYFYRRFYSNHYAWNQDLKNIYRVRAQGSLSFPSWNTLLTAGVENISHYVYFDHKAKASQYDGQIQILYAQWKQALAYRLLHFDFNVVGQWSSHQEVLPLPNLAAYANLYIRTRLSKVMLTHIGVDCRYFSSYYIPAYNPALGQYHLQNEKKVGDYPYINVYANMHLKRARFFIMYTHGSRLFVDPNYFTTLHYPQNPSQIKAGLSWNFYD